MREKVSLLRFYLVGAIIVFIWLFLANRLVHIQLVNGKVYSEKSKRQSEQRISLRGRRGNILDRNGVILAVDLSAYSLAANPKEVKHPKGVAAYLAALTGKPSSFFFNRLQHHGSFVWLARKLDRRIAKRRSSLDLQGIREIEEPKRVYPLGSVARQLLGSTDIDGRGIEGVEFAFNDYLRGVSMWSTLRVDARGKRVPLFENAPRHLPDGANVVLTIDSRYQAIAEEELRAAIARFDAKAGIAVIMNPKTGEVLAMASVPSYGPDSLSVSRQLCGRNRAIIDCFEPGSIFKVVVVSAALEEGLKTPTDLIYCGNGEIKIAGETIHDWHNFGWLSLKDVIKYSSDVGTIKIAQTVGKRRFYKYIRAFGFGTETGIRLPGEARGIVHSPSSWSKRSLATIAIGQEISATALQLATAYCAIANHGYLMKPHILKLIKGKNGQVIERQSPEIVRRVISEKTARELTDMLCAVVDSGTGVEAKVKGFSIAGKTGTAQVSFPDKRGYDPQKVICSFVGFLPAEDPQLLCLVTINEPQKKRWAGEVAAPTFRRIVSRILSLNDCPIKRKSQRIPVAAGSSRLAFFPGDHGEESLTGQRAVSFPVPKVVGMTLREAVEILHQRGIQVKIVGTGVVQRQVPEAGSRVKPGTVCLLEAKSTLQ